MVSKKYLINSYFIIFMLILAVSCTQSKSEIKNEDQATKVSVSDLVNNPKLHDNKPIQIEATARFIGENYYSGKGDFFLEENGNKIKIASWWAPITVAHCPPNVKDCKPPLTMMDYMDKKVRLNGIFKDNSITDVTDAAIIQDS